MLGGDREFPCVRLKALAEVVDSILNRGADPNSVAAKNTVAGSVAGTYL